MGREDTQMRDGHDGACAFEGADVLEREDVICDGIVLDGRLEQ